MSTSLSGFTLAQLRNATAAQIRTAMTTRLGSLDRKQLIRLDLYCASYDKDAVVRIPDDAQREAFPDGQAKRHVEVERDVLGAVVGGRVTEWSYYPKSGCVDEITTTTTDAAGKVKWRKIKHDEKGGQPTVTEG